MDMCVCPPFSVPICPLQVYQQIRKKEREREKKNWVRTCKAPKVISSILLFLVHMCIWVCTASVRRWCLCLSTLMSYVDVSFWICFYFYNKYGGNCVSAVLECAPLLAMHLCTLKALWGIFTALQHLLFFMFHFFLPRYFCVCVDSNALGSWIK